MYFFRRHKNLKIHLILVVLAVTLRSFIAPGYMLSISVDGGLGLAFCDGPVAMYQANDTHAHHNHDGNDSEAESHISTSCSFWSTSSMLVLNPVLEADLITEPRKQNQTAYQGPNLNIFIVNSRIIRAPPVYS